VRSVLNSFQSYLEDKNTWGIKTRRPWTKSRWPISPPSSDFMRLAIAAGGLGVLAGDHAKSAVISASASWA